MDDQCDAIDSTLGARDGFRINKEFEQDLMSFGQVRFGRAIGPFRRRQIGKNRKPSHIISGCQWSVAQFVCLRPGWQAMAIVFYNGELTIDHGLLSDFACALRWRRSWLIRTRPAG